MQLTGFPQVTIVGNDIDRLNAEDRLRRFGGLGQQPHIDHLVGDLLLDDQLGVLGSNPRNFQNRLKSM
ncbi:MAG: hypothetical protein JO266_09790 [Acidobacteria bacterium]|nr:hypothetical protein [Acidobacteriota bacterium]